MQRKYDVCVVGGAGHIGLPLSLAFADAGRKVVINDLNKHSLMLLEEGQMPFQEEGTAAILQKQIKRNLFTSADPEVIRAAEFVIVTIGTPVDEHLNPTYHAIKRFFETLLPYFDAQQTVILRSTIYPGTTEKVRKLLQKHIPGIEVCFCPERIAEGKAMEELYTLPQIISGYEEKALKKTGDLFLLLTKELLPLEPLEAELAKLFNNSWRYLQFSAANQFYMLANQCGADFYKIFNAMTHNYPRAKNLPRPGFAAGPCLLKDTMQISSFSQNNFFLGHSAMLINEGLPNFVVEQAKKKYPLATMKTGILGMAFKAESDDIRDSLSYKLRKVLEIESDQVFCSDEYVSDPSFLKASELIAAVDIIFIGAPHQTYRSLDYQGKVVIDVWNHIDRATAPLKR